LTKVSIKNGVKKDDFVHETGSQVDPRGEATAETEAKPPAGSPMEKQKKRES
jgi:hypothetical protein